MKRIHDNITGELSHRQLNRDRIDLLRNRIQLLTGDDRITMTMYLENSNSFRQIAKLTGVNECTVARRIHKITKRLMDGYFILCLRNRDRLSSLELKIAKDFFVNALPMTKIAEKKKISYHRVRKAIRNIKKCISV
jgi:predicted DNA-binding protein YlxM (UPF0122 family)